MKKLLPDFVPRRCRKLALLACAVVTLAQIFGSLPLFAQSSTVNCSDLGKCEKGVANVILPRVESAASSLAPEVQANIQTWNGTTQKWENFRGSDMGPDAAYQDDAGVIISNFQACQGGRNHTLESLTTPALIEGGPCFIYFHYQGGDVAGLCVHTESCGCLHCPCNLHFVFADLVDYYFPTAVIDASEEPLQSVYIDKDDAEKAISINEDFYDLAAQNAVLTINQVNQTVAQASGMLGVPVDQAAPAQRNVADEAVQAIKELKAIDPNLLFTAPSHEQAYARIFEDRLNVDSLAMRSIPHVAKIPVFGTDMPPGYIFSKSIFGRYTAKDEVGAIDSNINNGVMSDKFAEFFRTGLEMYRCLVENQAIGKTPKILGTAFGTSARTPFPFDNLNGATVGADSGTYRRQRAAKVPFFMPLANDISTDLCFKKVGNRYPLTAWGNPDITDRFWSSVAKVLDLFHELYGDFGNNATGANNVGLAEHWAAPRQSYLEKASNSFDEDHFLVLRNDALREETPQCTALADMPKINRDYIKSNLKTARSGGENSVSLFTHFRGCWGFKGVDVKDFWNGGCGFQGLNPSSPKLRLH